MDTLEITTGLKRIDIVRDGLSVGQITFNPADASFADRFYHVLSEFRKKMDEYKDRYVGLREATADSEDDLESAPEQIKLLTETCEYVRGQIDYLFGDTTSSIVFGDALVLEAYEQFFEKISPFIMDARAVKIKQYLPKNGQQKTKRTRAHKK